MVWEKFQNKIKQYIHKRKHGIDLERQPLDPLLILGQVTRELQAAISEHTKGLAVSKQRQDEIGQYLRQLQQEQKHLFQLFSRAQAKQDQAAIQDIKQQITLCQEQITRYEQLHNSMTNSIREVEQTIAKLQFKLNETKAKESVLVLKRNTANTQKELGKQLSRVDLEEQESEIERMEAEAEALLQLSNADDPQKELNTLDQELAKQLQLQTIENQLKTQKLEIEQKQAELLDKYFQLFNSSNTTQQNQNTNKQQVVDSFFQQTKDNEPAKYVDKFFTETPSSTKEDTLNSFFETDKKNTDNPKKQIIDDFFND